MTTTRATHSDGTTICTVRVPRDADADIPSAKKLKAGVGGAFGQEFLQDHVRKLLAFYDPVVLDTLNGGYHNQLRDDGTVYDPSTKHTVGTSRFVVNYCLAAELFPEKREHYLKTYAQHGLDFLRDKQMDRGGWGFGGFCWVVEADGSMRDGQKWCYSVAFGLLALASAARAGLDVAAQLTTVLLLAESKYYEYQHKLYIDCFDRGMTCAMPYRGQNANMHMCEAMLALWRATGESKHLKRARDVAHKLCVELAPVAGLVCEHFTQDWKPDVEKNKGVDPSSEEYIFRPYGFQPGHSFEWAKLLVLMERYCVEDSGRGPPVASMTSIEAPCPRVAPEAWMVEVAEKLFARATENGWDAARGGVCYTFELSGKVLDGNKYYWALAEMIGAAAVLAVRTGTKAYWAWYEKAWAFALAHFVDAEQGGWYPMLNADNVRVDTHAAPGHTGAAVKCYPSKTDYHPLAACYEALEALKLA